MSKLSRAAGMAAPRFVEAKSDAAQALIARSVANDRGRMVPPPVPDVSGRRICGCSPDPEIGPSSIDDVGACLRCSPGGA